MILLEATPPSPDTLFWYTIAALLSTVLFGLLVWLISKYLSENKEILTGIKDTLNRLVTNDAVKEQRINDMDERIEGIEERIFPINYNKRPKRSN